MRKGGADKKKNQLSQLNPDMIEPHLTTIVGH